MIRRLNGFAAAVADEEPIIDAHFATTRVSAEVVMVVENQDAGTRARLTVEVGRGQTADARADNDEIDLAFVRHSGKGESPPVPQRMRRCV